METLASQVVLPQTSALGFIISMAFICAAGVGVAFGFYFIGRIWARAKDDHFERKLRKMDRDNTT